ncbi:MAG: hypothetical protein HQK54_02330 [Oligoflexales bacterium]|nr:hypothetical protein [Oligoflexales bacterium]
MFKKNLKKYVAIIYIFSANISNQNLLAASDTLSKGNTLAAETRVKRGKSSKQLPPVTNSHNLEYSEQNK